MGTDYWQWALSQQALLQQQQSQSMAAGQYANTWAFSQGTGSSTNNFTVGALASPKSTSKPKTKAIKSPALEWLDGRVNEICLSGRSVLI